MIFYFSGTGNSLWVAKKLHDFWGGNIVSIAEELNTHKNDFTFDIKPNEKIFFVFPVHSWGPSILVPKFIYKINLTGYSKQEVFSVATCGDNCGYTTRVMRDELRKKDIQLTKGYSIQMPNNYILMKRFGTDPIEIANNKLKKAPFLLHEIIDDIQQKTSKKLYETGKYAFLKTYLIYPLFKKFAVNKPVFYAKDTCTSCGLCTNICPCKSIYFVEEKPKWTATCVHCTACINNCPAQAIEYGKTSQNKIRYHHPDNAFS